jgi:hypothetical protein
MIAFKLAAACSTNPTAAIAAEAAGVPEGHDHATPARNRSTTGPVGNRAGRRSFPSNTSGTGCMTTAAGLGRRNESCKGCNKTPFAGFFDNPNRGTGNAALAKWGAEIPNGLW